ncbi:GNAT family N-acetyltransferase [Paenibacillus roseipurpureus]|uniref:GNAT family N-acetyltransferase n=1 Tax=Paenibacillus roseopurpureus TaxID=2918901 RepID=A0AA96RLF2_9BACL|nr:GNAT family N-acetyltransferase [Paenibacillus sp. MBLB1832]WNR45349.1 GNAT family N-acetyltransferase [Paenibacillus sp. MBLB1832]
MSIRVLEEHDAAIYQAVRLSGLSNNPEAFGSTYERELSFSLETVAERIKPSQDKFVLGAFDERGKLVGIVTFVRENGIKTAHKGNVFGMYVAQEARGRGWGKSLMLELIRRASLCEGVEQINLAVMSDNEAAKKLYQSLGFKLYGVEVHALKYQGTYYDEDFMVLRLDRLGN